MPSSSGGTKKKCPHCIIYLLRTTHIQFTIKLIFMLSNNALNALRTSSYINSEEPYIYTQPSYHASPKLPTFLPLSFHIVLKAQSEKHKTTSDTVKDIELSLTCCRSGWMSFKMGEGPYMTWLAFGMVWERHKITCFIMMLIRSLLVLLNVKNIYPG